MSGAKERTPETRLREQRILEDGDIFFSDVGSASAGFLVDKLWGEGAAGWIAGEPKTGKTWLVIELIIAITTGHAAFGRFACERPGRVLYVAEEGSRRKFQERLAGLCSAYEVPLADVTARLDVVWRRHVDLLDPAWQRDLLAIAPHYRAIFLDPLRDMHGADEDRVHQIKPVLDFLRFLQEKGPAVLAVMHLRKQRNDDHKVRAGQRVAGTRHFHSFLDSALYLDRQSPDQDWPVKVSVEHRDEDAIDAFLVELEVEDSADQPDFRLIAQTNRQGPCDRYEELGARAVEIAREHGPVSKTELGMQLGVGKQVGLQVVGSCLERGLLVRTPDGKRVMAPPESVLSPEPVPNPPEPPKTPPPSLLSEPASERPNGRGQSVPEPSEPSGSPPDRFPAVPPYGGENRPEPDRGCRDDGEVAAGQPTAEAAILTAAQTEVEQGGAERVDDASSELVGTGELCSRWGLHRQQLKRWRDAGKFPEPAAKLKSGPVWRRAEADRAHEKLTQERLAAGASK